MLQDNNGTRRWYSWKEGERKTHNCEIPCIKRRERGVKLGDRDQKEGEVER
jgi:hypothetical protein